MLAKIRYEMQKNYVSINAALKSRRINMAQEKLQSEYSLKVALFILREMG